MFSEQIIKRAPDKMIDYKKGHILLAFRSTIVQLNVSAYVDDKSQGEPNAKDGAVELRGHEVTTLSLAKQHYKIICFTAIGQDTSAIVVENLNDR